MCLGSTLFVFNVIDVTAGVFLTAFGAYLKMRLDTKGDEEVDWLFSSSIGLGSLLMLSALLSW
jgi:hypothetical protein